MKDNFAIEHFGGWYWYFSGKEDLLDDEKCGKWMHFFSDQEFAKTICQKAITEDVCYECKCADLTAHNEKTGPICFYINGDDIEAHKKVIKFMLENNLIRKTKSGRLYDESFKFDNQTRAGEYGSAFNAAIKLSQFLNLYTGEWIFD